jgi:hypothetical protein
MARKKKKKGPPMWAKKKGGKTRPSLWAGSKKKS